MIERLQGVIVATEEKTITLIVGGIGFGIAVANPKKYVLDETASLLIYFHWNQERGPGLYGFATELERKLFLLLIEVQKIGPSLAIQILSQASPEQLIPFIQAEQVKSLSSLHGIGVKKAEQIIHDLKSKIGTLATELQKTNPQSQPTQGSAHLFDVLTSLGYSKIEISSALSFVHGQNDGSSSFDQILRTALQHLSKNKML
jgi:Holliday junction DNA helicase RuvA